MFSRREAIRILGLGAGALSPLLAQFRAQAEGDPKKLPKRFVFVVRASGILSTEIQPEGWSILSKREPMAAG